MNTKKIRVIFFKEDGKWIAQGLEHDICVQADAMRDLYGRFEVAVRLESSEPNGLDRIPEAPKFFQTLWEQRSGDITPTSIDEGCFEFGIAA